LRQDQRIYQEDLKLSGREYFVKEIKS